MLSRRNFFFSALTSFIISEFNEFDLNVFFKAKGEKDKSEFLYKNEVSMLPPRITSSFFIAFFNNSFDSCIFSFEVSDREIGSLSLTH